MLGDDPQDLAAVGAVSAKGSALGSDQGDKEVNEAHKQAAENPRLGGVHGHPARLGDPMAADHLDHHNAEGQPRQGVQGVVALQEAGEEGAAPGGVALCGNHLGGGGYGINQGGDHQGKQEHQEHRIQNLADPGHDPAGLQGEQQHHSEENKGEQGQIQPGVPPADQVHGPHGEGGAGAAGNGEQRPDGEIQQGAEEHAVFLAHLIGKGHHALAPAQAQSNHRQHGDAHGGDEYPQEGAPQVASGVNAHFRREDQVSGSKEHTEEHTGDGDGFRECKIPLHGEIILSMLNGSILPHPGGENKGKGVSLKEILLEICFLRIDFPV